MKTRSEKLNQVASGIAKICAVFNWVCCGFFMLALVFFLVLYLIAPESLAQVLVDLDANGVIYFFFLPTNWSSIPPTTSPSLCVLMGAFLILQIVESGLLGMIFRNINRIFQISAGKTKASLGPTPFQPANVKLLRQIGLFAIGIPLVELIVLGGMALLMGSGVFASIGIDLGFIILGIVVLCLSQFFAYGVELQTDVDGLL